ncbi:hypothetical protein [Maribacter sp. ACAM166]|uniref:hypothetical protein n=1 Tax=Maribacter sp. ACAM166 TaxID=2508996 RepID=UPI003977485F
MKNAFERSADLDANNTTISTVEHTVTLKGKVNFLKEKEDADTAAYGAPGV